MHSFSSYTINIRNLTHLSQLCATLAPLLKKQDVIALHGNLGAGKTTLTQYLLDHIGIPKHTVTSPTFNLVQVYTKNLTTSIWHFDLYRLNFPEEIYEVGFEEALSEGISIIEWPEKLDHFLPKNHLAIHLEFDKKKENNRKLTFTPKGNWKNKYHDLFNCLTSFNFEKKS